MAFHIPVDLCVSASVSLAAIKDEETVRSVTQNKPKGKCAKFATEQQMAIGKYDSLPTSLHSSFLSKSIFHHCFNKKVDINGC